MLYETIKNKQNKGKQVVLLIDPDKHSEQSLFSLLDKAVLAGISFILIGGSLTSKSINENIVLIKQYCNIPVFLFLAHCYNYVNRPMAFYFYHFYQVEMPTFLSAIMYRQPHF